MDAYILGTLEGVPAGTVADPRGEGGPGGPDPPIRPDACLILEFLHRQDRISLLKWLIISMKDALNFATKLNSRNITKNCFGVPNWLLTFTD